uniref:Uncharacterized protein n=1 Tax=Chromera velia CCMP2878 TaxID=1169474 RepID=A0A0G4G0S3_9ALVE|eukprot:Cvel_3985.t1-p1 / transcript=Cvel_3985.t1 / gene=Cvel_3985 / organism=Chromera_velia_CCMP2878 / gene_product=hypothetical protein / transcript_product=hypothetical protein / location=Cvel_scaffold169:41236-50763(+) / protein_length=597 / sequence_SO=supercontig / SO=protein_coding / is_pseudo=false
MEAKSGIRNGGIEASSSAVHEETEQACPETAAHLALELDHFLTGAAEAAAEDQRREGEIDLREREVELMEKVVDQLRCRGTPSSPVGGETFSSSSSSSASASTESVGVRPVGSFRIGEAILSADLSADGSLVLLGGVGGCGVFDRISGICLRRFGYSPRKLSMESPFPSSSGFDDLEETAESGLEGTETGAERKKRKTQVQPQSLTGLKSETERLPVMAGMSLSPCERFVILFGSGEFPLESAIPQSETVASASSSSASASSSSSSSGGRQGEKQCEGRIGIAGGSVDVVDARSGTFMGRLKDLGGGRGVLAVSINPRGSATLSVGCVNECLWIPTGWQLVGATGDAVTCLCWDLERGSASSCRLAVGTSGSELLLFRVGERGEREDEGEKKRGGAKGGKTKSIAGGGVEKEREREEAKGGVRLEVLNRWKTDGGLLSAVGSEKGKGKDKADGVSTSASSSSGGVRSLCFLNDGLLQSVSGDGSVAMWKEGADSCLKRSQGGKGGGQDSGRSAKVSCGVPIGDGKLTVLGALDGSLRVLESESLREVRVLSHAHRDAVTAVCAPLRHSLSCSPQPFAFASASLDSRVIFWELQNQSD